MDLTGFWKIGNTSADETEWMGKYVCKNPREAVTSELASTQGQIKGVWKSRKCPCSASTPQSTYFTQRTKLLPSFLKSKQNKLGMVAHTWEAKAESLQIVACLGYITRPC